MSHTWFNNAENDDQVKQLSQNTILNAAELDDLCKPRGWLSGALIHYGVLAYGGERRNPHNHVLWIDPVVVVAGKDGDDEAFDNSIGKALGGAPLLLDFEDNDLPEDATIILFPVNTGNVHWSLLAFYKEDRKFIHYDSLGYTNDIAAKNERARSKRK